MLQNLKSLRMEYGISQQRLAEALGLTQPSINKYENHNIEPEIAILVRMTDYFNTSVDYLIGHTNVRRKIERTEEYALNKEESEMITRYRALREEEKRCVQTVVQTFLSRP